MNELLVCNTLESAKPQRSTMQYLDKPVRRAELEVLATLARAEESSFFHRNLHLVSVYRDRLIAGALCQGAALQYLGLGYGVKDFDIHFFYLQNPVKRRLSRKVKRTWATIGSFPDCQVDFIRSVVPSDAFGRENSIELLRRFLSRRPTNNAGHLAQKAVIGLLPENLFGLTLWPE
jgi:hypothetical protein